MTPGSPHGAAVDETRHLPPTLAAAIALAPLEHGPWLGRPVVSAGMIAKEHNITPRAAQNLVAELGLREATGRGPHRGQGRDRSTDRPDRFTHQGRGCRRGKPCRGRRP